MICPKCNKAEVKENVSHKKVLFNWRKIIEYYCVQCDFANKKEFKLTKEDYYLSLQKEKEKPTDKEIEMAKYNVDKYLEEKRIDHEPKKIIYETNKNIKDKSKIHTIERRSKKWN